ncbi:MAG: hypothetical protein V2A69_09320 [Pseudomonadota bacterium]
MKTRKILDRENGFTLIGIALLVLAIGIIAVIAGVLGVKLQSIARERDTVKRMTVIRNALKDYYRGHQDLPAPVGTGADEVPVQDLNLEQKYRVDTWGQYFFYRRDTHPSYPTRTDIVGLNVNGNNVASIVISFGPDQTQDTLPQNGNEFTTTDDDIVTLINVQSEAIEIANNELHELAKKACAYGCALGWPPPPPPEPEVLKINNYFLLNNRYLRDPWLSDYQWHSVNPPGIYSLGPDRTDAVPPDSSDNIYAKVGGLPCCTGSFFGWPLNENVPQAIDVSSTNSPNDTLVFGNNTNNTQGTILSPYAQTLIGKTMRVFFEFQFSNQDTSGDSKDWADGFTFAVLQGNSPTNIHGTWTPSGSGQFGEFLGYNRLGYGADGTGSTLTYKSFAVEFDTYPNNPANAPYDQNDPPLNHNHVAVDKNGSTFHDGTNNPLCNGSNQGCVFNAFFGHSFPVTWLEDGIVHKARIEVHTSQCVSGDTDCEICLGTSGYAYIKVWIDCTGANCNDLSGDYNGDLPTVTHCFPLDPAFSTVKYGFTEGTGGKNQTVTITNFAIGFY